MRVLVFVALSIACAAALADEMVGGTDFNDVQLDQAGVIKGNYKNGRIIESMSGGVKMTFLGETPRQNIKLTADRVDFEYASDETNRPSKITMRGHVTILVEGNRVDSGSAVFDLEAGLATFTERPVIDMDDGERKMKLAASKILLNLETGDFEVHDGQRIHKETD